MAQKFLIVGTTAYRDAMDAVKDEKFDQRTLETVELTSTQRINELYRVAQLDENGNPGSIQYVRNFDEIEDIFGKRAKIAYEIIYAFPYVERKKRTDVGKPRGERQAATAE